jgi:polyphosphate kinase 2 (PPK2 family)
MKKLSDKYCVCEGEKVNLKKWSITVRSIYNFKKYYHKKLADQIALIGIFNRSYYEEVLITRIHLDVLQAEGVPILDINNKKKSKKKIWTESFNSITDFEKHLQWNGTKVIKFFLHLSKEEQSKRFLACIDEPEKNFLARSMLY